MKRKLIKRNKHKLSTNYNFDLFLPLGFSYSPSIIQTNLDRVYYWSSAGGAVRIKRFMYTRRHQIPDGSCSSFSFDRFGIPTNVPKTRNLIIEVYLHEEKVEKKKYF